MQHREGIQIPSLFFYAFHKALLLVFVFGTVFAWAIGVIFA